MNNTVQQRARWATIKSRPSIHSHDSCVFSQGERVYGIRVNSNHPENDDSDNEQGVDYSESILEEERETIVENWFRELSLERGRRDQRLMKVLLYVVGTIAAVAAVFAVCTWFNIGHIPNTSIQSLEFHVDVNGLGEKSISIRRRIIRIDKISILTMQTAISAIFEEEDSESFMFVYNGNDKNFNLSEFNEFITDISLAASKYLRNNSSFVYTSVDGCSLDMGELMCRHRAELAASGVLLVRHLEAVPARVAHAFHYFYDMHSPLVKKSAIFFTLDVANCPQQSGIKNAHAVVRKCLAEKWDDVPAGSIGPLLRRVVSVVVDVTRLFST